MSIIQVMDEQNAFARMVLYLEVKEKHTPRSLALIVVHEILR